MSKQFLQKLLEEEVRLVSRQRRELDKSAKYKAHKLSMSSLGVYNSINKQLIQLQAADPEILNSEEMQTLIRRGANIIVEFVYRRATNLERIKTNVSVTGNRAAFSALVTESSSLTDSGTVKHENVFNSIRSWYQRPQKAFVSDLNKFLAKSGSTVQVGGLLDLGHRGNSAISRETINTSQARIKSAVKSSGKDVNITDKDLKRLGLTFSLSKKSTPDLDYYEVGVEDLIGNREEGLQVLGPRKKKYLEALKNAQKKLAKDTILSESSDSRPTIERKKIVKTFEDSVKGKKNVRKTKSDTKLRLANSKVTKTVTKKVTRGNAINASNQPLKGVNKVKKATTESNITLAALINQKLPATVMKNMRVPGLQNRSGRFAKSARVTDVIRTTKGFPSIGYTYMKYPYQTFEPGYKQGSLERDPRKVIDKSIREIAAELLVGRFYTRRV